MRRLWAAVACALAGAACAEVTSIYKVGFPDGGLCGQEDNVTKSITNPHWFFPMTFGGFREGVCAEIGYTRFERIQHVVMHHHNLTFKLYAPTQTPTVDSQVPDPSRNRTINMKLCMPASAERRAYPLYVFGHGAGCDAQDYQYFCQVAVVALLYHDTPGHTLFPDDFDTDAAAEDMAFLSKALPAQAKDPTSALFGKLDGTVLLGGHSMGGGVTVLAVGGRTARPSGLVLFAPGLYTRPNASPFLRSVIAPALVVSGSMDCGSNSLEKEAQPTYDGLASTLKALVVVKGANHCQWTEPFERVLGICSTFGRNEAHGISRLEQHAIGQRLVQAFARATELGTAGWGDFEEALRAGEAEGAWTYAASTARPGRRLHNDCPHAAAEILV